MNFRLASLDFLSVFPRVCLFVSSAPVAAAEVMAWHLLGGPRAAPPADRGPGSGRTRGSGEAWTPGLRALDPASAPRLPLASDPRTPLTGQRRGPPRRQAAGTGAQGPPRGRPCPLQLRATPGPPRASWVHSERSPASQLDRTEAAVGLRVQWSVRLGLCAQGEAQSPAGLGQGHVPAGASPAPAWGPVRPLASAGPRAPHCALFSRESSGPGGSPCPASRQCTRVTCEWTVPVHAAPRLQPPRTARRRHRHPRWFPPWTAS